MSVINKMLRDLDERQNNDAHDAIYIPPAKKPWLLWISLLLLLLVVLAWALSQWMLSNTAEMPAKPVTVAKLVQHTNAAEVAPVEQIAAEPQVQLGVNPDNNISDTVNLVTTDTDSSIEDVVVAKDMATVSAPESQLKQQSLTSSEQVAPSTAKLIEQIAHLQKVLADDKKVVPQKQVESPVVNPDNKEEDKTSSFSVKAVKQTKKQQIEELQTQIQYALAESDNNEAEQLLTKLLALEPTHSKARQMLANLFNSNGKYAQAQQVLQQGLLLNQEDVDVRIMLARFFTQQDHADNALELLNAYRPDIHTHIHYFALKASVADAIGRFDVAQDTYQSLTFIQPQNSKWWLGLAISADRQSQFDVAKDAYQNVVKLGPQSDSIATFVTQRLAQLRGE